MKKLLLIFIPVLFYILFSLLADNPATDTRTGFAADSRNTASEIWIITDVHFLSNKLRDESPRFSQFIETSGGTNILRINSVLTAFISAVKENPPAAVLVTGDLTFNGEKLSHKELAGRFREIESLGTQVYVIPGNHDIQNPWARRITEKGMSKTPSVTAKEFSSIYKNFGYRDALSYDPDSLSYVIEPLPDMQVLMLDTCRYDNNLNYGIPVSAGMISPATKSWIKESVETARRKGKQILAAMHHPLLEHNPMVSEGFTIDNNQSLIDFFSELNIRIFLTGHIHIQDIIQEEAPDGRQILDISTNALSVYPHNYATIRPEQGTWLYTAKSLSARPELFTEDLSDSFQTFFTDSSDLIIKKSLDTKLYSSEEIADMSTFFSQANIHFFSGNESPEDHDPAALALFQRDTKSFLSKYLHSILEDSPPGDQSVKLAF